MDNFECLIVVNYNQKRKFYNEKMDKKIYYKMKMSKLRFKMNKLKLSINYLFNLDLNVM